MNKIVAIAALVLAIPLAASCASNNSSGTVDKAAKTTADPAPADPVVEPEATDTTAEDGLATTDPGSGTAPADVATAPATSTVWTADEDKNATVKDGGLKTLDVVAGTGEELVAGKNANVKYTGWLTDGTKFDSNVESGQAFTTQIPGQVIDGWNVGLLGMKEGGKRKLLIPASMGYGPGGMPPKIPGNATLVFEVELIDVS